MSAIADHHRRDHHRISRRGVGMAALISALAMTGCTFGTGEPGSGSSTATDEGSGASDGADPGTASEDTDSGDTAVVDEGAAAAGVDLTEVGEPIATAEVPAVVEGDTAATMTVALYGLRREGRTLVATYSFTVHSETSDAEEWLYTYLGGQSWQPYAVDTVNLNKHGVLSGSVAERAQTDSQGMVFRPGQTLFAYAMFAAPPEAVTTMDVLLVEGAPLATGVEIR